MVNPPSLPLHIDRQFAVSLLGPVENTLNELATRLHQYVQRVPLSAADREAVEAAEAAIKQAAHTVRDVLAGRRAPSEG